MWDVIAIRRDVVRLIQVKTYRPVPKQEREALIAFSVPMNVVKESWVWYDYQGQPVVTEL